MSAIPDSTPSSVECTLRAILERLDDLLKRTEDMLARLDRMEALATALSDSDKSKEPPLYTVH